ncbi:MAG: HlyD family type I secretion periplasmic adaptor subunit [Pseudomonadota bacterium]
MPQQTSDGHLFVVGDQKADPAQTQQRQKDPKGPAVPNDYSRWVKTGVLCILLVLGTLGGFGIAAPIASAVIAAGNVTVDTNRKNVAHLEGGVVAALHVRNGSHVDAGDVLIELNETRARARISILQAGIDTNVARYTRLAAEAAKLETLEFPSELTDRAEEKAVTEVIKSETEVFEARRLTIIGQTDILERRVEQLNQQVVGLEAQLEAEQRRKEIIDQEIETLEPLFEKGLISLQRILALRREAVQMEGSIGSIFAEIARSKQAVGETRLQIIQTEKQFQEEVLSELIQTQAQLKDLREQYSAGMDVLERSDMIAPVSGTVVNLDVHSQGAVVRPGATVLEIVPDQDELLIEVQVQPQDVDNVTIHQAATIRMSAFPQRTTPLLHGSVSYVSPDTMLDERTGSTFFNARISVPREELERLGEDKQVNPGMPAEVMIKTGSRTAVDYLLEPIVESMNRAWREN